MPPSLRPGWCHALGRFRIAYPDIDVRVTASDDIVDFARDDIDLAIRYGGEYAQIEELIVDPRARGLKAGAALVRASIEAARAHGCREIGLYSREQTRAFYEKLGFSYTGPELRQSL